MVAPGGIGLLACMSTLTPAMARAFALLRDELYEYLDDTEVLTEVDEQWHDRETERARGLLRDLVQVVRSVLAGHEPDSHGGCRLCRSRHWPCATVETIDRVLRDPRREFVRITHH